MTVESASASGLRGALDLDRIGAGAVDEREAAGHEAVVIGAAAGDGEHRRAGLRRQRGRTDRQRGRLAAQLDRDVAAPVAAVAEEDEVLVVAQHLEHAAQVAPADDVDVLARAFLGEVVVEPAVGRVVGDHVQRLADALQRRTDHVHAADVRGAQQHALPLGARLLEDLEVLDAHEAPGILIGQLADAHHVDEVLRVVAEGAARGVANARVVGRQAHRPRQVLGDESLLRPGQVVGDVADGRRGRHRQRARQRADQPLAAAVEPEGQLLALPLAAGACRLANRLQRRIAGRLLHAGERHGQVDGHCTPHLGG